MPQMVAWVQVLWTIVQIRKRFLQVQAEFLLGFHAEYQSSTSKVIYFAKLAKLLNFSHNDKCFTSPLSIAHRKSQFLQARVHSLMKDAMQY